MKLNDMPFITLEQYFGDKPYTTQEETNAVDLLNRVNGLAGEYQWRTGCLLKIDVDTGTFISGSKNGAGDGGFRLPDAETGRPNSSHKEAKGVDVFDGDGEFSKWITDELLEKYGLFREAPSYTPGWVHLQTRPVRSGNRTYRPH